MTGGPLGPWGEMCAFYTFLGVHDSRFAGAARRRGDFSQPPLLDVTWGFHGGWGGWGDLSSLGGGLGMGFGHANSYWDVLGT